ncbi:MAG: ATP-binding protein [Candidatus Krumholzibacteriia bacterium]
MNHQDKAERLTSVEERLRARIEELEAALARAHEGDTRYRDLFEASADAILVIDGDRFVDCNPATVAMLRYGSKEELLQTHPSELSPEFQVDGRRSFEKANEMMRIASERGSHRFEWLHRRADGEVFPVEVLLTAVPYGDRTMLHTVWRDITGRKQLEDELRQAQKLEAVGKLAGGIAHDFNNLLMAISGNAELLQVECEAGTENAEIIAEILHASERAAALIEQLLAYSRKQILQPRVLDLCGVFKGLNQMLGRLLGEDVAIVLHLDAEPLPVLVDPSQMEQVVMNLATNARDAMPDGGTLVFTTGRLEVREDDPHPLLCPGRYAVLGVQDTGTGIPPENIRRIFDPFFTTKEMGRGTGLGLSTVYGIIKQSGGEVTVESRQGEGTEFTIFLPLHESEEGPAPETEAAPPADLQGRETILLVEDEPTLLRLVEKVLVGKGYTVHTAANGRAALEAVEQEGLEFDLLVTDVIMPELGGPELAACLTAVRPGLQVLYISGYTDSVLLQRGLVAGDVDFVAKPFGPKEFLSKVREILDRG